MLTSYMYYYWDPTYFLVIIGAVICMIASARVNATFNKYAKVRSTSGITGADAARQLLNSRGIYDVQIQRVSGNLTDHYDPKNKVLRLSDSVYGSSSVASIGVAAHECGHAIQHAEGYAPLSLRSSMVPVVNIASTISWPLILIGFLLNGSMATILLQGGILLFSLAVLFQLVTLPVEYNASSRAMALLEQNGILYQEELKLTKKVLSAAALTYVAGAASSLLQLLRLVILVGGRRRD